MPDTFAKLPPTLSPLAQRLRFGLVLAMIFGLLIAIGALSLEVRSRLAALKQADSDNGQWVIMQTEVEVLRLRYAVRSALSSPGGVVELAEVRRWFDVLYSRLNLLRRSPLYTEFTRLPEPAEQLSRMFVLLDGWMPAIDGPDSALSQILPRMRDEGIELHDLARNLSLSALQGFAASTDATRDKISDTLVRLAVTTGTMILLLGLLAVILLQTYRHARQQAEQNLVTGRRLQLIIATSPDAIVVITRDGLSAEFNPAAEAIFGLARPQVLGRKVLPLLFPPDRQAETQQALDRAIAASAVNGPQRFELEGLRADGSRFPLEISLAVRDLAEGGISVAFLRDISARKAAESALAEALEKSRAGEKAKAEFLAVMSHEMRTPLNGLIGSLDLLHDTKLSPEQAHLLKVMEVSGNILLGHVNSVLDIARAEAGEISLADTPFDLDQVIEGVIDNQFGLASRKGCTITHAALTGPLGVVRGDPTRVGQILLNLVGNAVKFTENGTVTIETERLSPKAVGGRPGMVEFRIIDTGIGIAPEDQARIFEDFQTLDSSYGRAAGGTGLGLGIVRRLTRAMGGEIGVESEPGEGSVFWLRLPLREASLPAELATPTPPASARKRRSRAASGHNILVIEDNEINRFLLRRFLEEDGHQVTEAVDGVEGVALAMAEAFAVIVTDISMPRMDGIEATRRIRTGQGPSAQARIIALTAHALPEEVARFHAAGMDACLAKPVDRTRLLAEVHAAAPPTAPEAKRKPKPAAKPAAKRPPPADRLVDPAPVQDLFQELGPAIAGNLLSRLIEEGDATIRACTPPLAPTQHTAALAHRLAGSCATFGATALGQALIAYETATLRNQTDRATAVAADLPALWQGTRAALVAAQASLIPERSGFEG